MRNMDDKHEEGYKKKYVAACPDTVMTGGKRWVDSVEFQT